MPKLPANRGLDEQMKVVPRILPLSPMKRLVKKAAPREPTLRVQDGTARILRDIIEDYAANICTIAVDLAESRGSKTVNPHDIETAWERLKTANHEGNITPRQGRMVDEAIGSGD